MATGIDYNFQEETNTANVTHASIAVLFPQFDENIGSIVVSCFFLICYTIVLSVISGILIRYRKDMKRNQIIVFVMVSWCIIQQSIALLFRLGYNGKSLSMNLNYSDYSKIEDLNAHFLPIYICSAVESFAIYLQGVVVVVITCFILNMFLDTARILHAMSQKAYKIFKYLFNITISIFAVLILILALIHVAIVLASKITNSTFNIFPILVVIFVTFTVFLTIESLMFIFVGLRLIIYVKKHALKDGAQANANFLQRPETKIAGLIIGMLISGYFQVLAAIVGILTTTFDSTYHFIDYSLQAGGILLFSVFVLLVYNPLVSFSVKEGSSSSENLKSEEIKAPKLSSIRKNSFRSPASSVDCVSPSTTTSVTELSDSQSKL